jgi:hypothetical protein
VVARSVSLVAAVALLFGLPRCAIDDRDLEVRNDGNGGSSNGGSGGTGGTDPLCEPDPEDTPCQACARDRCCAQYVDCVMNAECGEYVTCGNMCADSDSACLSACDDEHPIGSALFYGFAACGLTECPDLCED